MEPSGSIFPSRVFSFNGLGSQNPVHFSVCLLACLFVCDLPIPPRLPLQLMTAMSRIQQLERQAESKEDALIWLAASGRMVVTCSEGLLEARASDHGVPQGPLGSPTPLSANLSLPVKNLGLLRTLWGRCSFSQREEFVDMSACVQDLDVSNENSVVLSWQLVCLWLLSNFLSCLLVDCAFPLCFSVGHYFADALSGVEHHGTDRGRHASHQRQP